MSSHGVMSNTDATRLDELMLADYLRPSGYRSALVGKADNRKDPEMLQVFGIDSGSGYAQAATSGGFEPFEVHEGLLPGACANNYTAYLNRNGYEGDNPWQDFAVSTVGKDGLPRSGWKMRNSAYPARIAEAHSETTYTTTRAIDFLEQQDDANPWCLHLSYIKPHWPYIAPSPYHELYDMVQ